MDFCRLAGKFYSPRATIGISRTGKSCPPAQRKTAAYSDHARQRAPGAVGASRRLPTSSDASSI